MFNDICINILQLYDVCKGKKKKSSLPFISYSKQIDLDKFYVGVGREKNHLEITSNKVSLLSLQ